VTCFNPKRSARIAQATGYETSLAGSEIAFLRIAIGSSRVIDTAAPIDATLSKASIESEFHRFGNPS